MHIRTLLAAMLISLAVPLHAQVTAVIEDIPGTSPADAFDISGMGTYNIDVMYKDDLYIAYWHGPGPTMKDDFATWTWDPVICSNFANPLPGTSPECNDRVMMAWKHFSCADPSWACGSNSYWNMYNGTKNYHTNPAVNVGNNVNYFTWKNTGAAPPPVRRMVGWSDIANFGYTPVTCRQEPGGPEYTISNYGGSGYPAVVYANGKWFMAYDTGLHSPANNGQTETDIHRIGWASSTDGANWTFHGVIMRDSSEAFCSDGMLPTELYFENNTFYLIVSSLSHGYSNGTNRLYLLKAPYSSTAATGFTAWYAPTGVNPTNNRLIYPATSNVSPATPLDFRSLQSLTNDERIVIDGSIAKVYASATSSLYRYVLLVNLVEAATSSGGVKVCPTPAQSYPIRVYTSTDLESFYTSYSDITAARNTSRLQSAGWYSWTPDFVHLVPNATYPKVSDPVTFFVNYCATNDNRNNIGRVRLNLSGGIYN